MTTTAQHKPEQASQRPTRREILRLAWPAILANATVPLLGLADTAVIGNFGSTSDLGAIAFGAVIFSFVYWSFGFLRMSTTGFIAQAAGARNEPEVRATLLRALLLAGTLGVVLIMLQWPLGQLSLWLLDGSTTVANTTSAYFHTRIWGAPAALALFALMGLLIGLRKTRLLLAAQVCLNGLNILLDILFAGVLGWGAQGIALGTALAEWLTLLGLGLVIWRQLRARHEDASPFLPMRQVFDRNQLSGLLSANLDIMVRTLLLVFSFAWFIRQSGLLGDEVLAAHHILLQFISFAAFFLDGFAYVVEALIGESMGAGDLDHFDRAVQRSTQLAAATAALLAASVLLGGNTITALLTVHEPVRGAVAAVLPWAAVYVLMSFAAFQLDGIFIGATDTAAMRNASALSVAVYLPLAVVLLPVWGAHGLWCAFVIYVCARAAALLCYYPRLRRRIAARGIAKSEESTGA